MKRTVGRVRTTSLLLTGVCAAAFCVLRLAAGGSGAATGISAEARDALEAGLAHAAGGRLAEASREMARAAELAPESAEVWHNFGILNAQMSRLDDAADMLQRAARLEPDYRHTHIVLGAVYQRMGRLSEAERAYRRAADLAPHLPDAHRALGLLAVARNDLPAARRGVRAGRGTGST